MTRNPSLFAFAVATLLPAPLISVATAEGDATVFHEGKPALTQADSEGGGSPDVFINGKPALRVGDITPCGHVVQGSSTVFINGRPAALAVPDCPEDSPLRKRHQGQ